MKSIALYIHIPWCVKKCPYCDFNSHQARGDIPESQYIAALINDFKYNLPTINKREISSIFFGGGTPSLFSADSINKILSSINKLIKFNNNIEITLEANPGTIEHDDFIEYYNAGINRVSLGAQSFNNQHLTKLGRIHKSSETNKAIAEIKKSGIKNFNIDLMYGLPNQTIQHAIDDLNATIAHNPTHISWYNLTIEPNTLFYNNTPPLPNDEATWEMQQCGLKILAENSYNQYEVSAFAKLNKQCLHNLNYWKFGDYLGIGAGAHSKITTNNIVTRSWCYKHPKQYLAQQDNYIAQSKQITTKQLPFEFMLNALRLTNGFNLNLFETTTNIDLSCIQDKLQQAKDNGLITINNNILTPTTLGKRFLNDLVSIWLE